MDTKTEGKEQI